MTDPILASQRRERLLKAFVLLKERYQSIFGETLEPRLLLWLNTRIEEEKAKAIKDALSHFEIEELLEFKTLVPASPPTRKKASSE